MGQGAGPASGRGEGDTLPALVRAEYVMELRELNIFLVLVQGTDEREAVVPEVALYLKLRLMDSTRRN